MRDQFEYHIPDNLPLGEKLRLQRLLTDVGAKRDPMTGTYLSPERVDDLEIILEWEAYYYEGAHEQAR